MRQFPAEAESFIVTTIGHQTLFEARPVAAALPFNVQGRRFLERLNLLTKGWKMKCFNRGAT